MTLPMTVTILGSGTCVPSLTRSASSVLVEAGSAKILIDIGPGTLRRLLEAGHQIGELTHLFITHFHPDHTSELVPLLFASKYPEERRRRSPLTLVAGPGFQRFFSDLCRVYGHWIDLGPGLLSIEEIPGGVRRFADFTVATGPVDHNPESVGFRVEDPSGRSLVYSGDTDVSDGLVALANAATLLICECAHPDHKKMPGHLTPSLAGAIAASAGAKRLVLTHFYPDCDGEDLASDCRRHFKGPVIVAEDLMTLTVD